MSPRPYSLRTHLALVILAAVVPSALLTGVIVWRTLEDARARLERRVADAARADTEALDREFDGTIRVLQTLAQSPSLDAGDVREFLAEAARAVRAQQGWFAVVLAAPDGRQLINTTVPFGEPLRGPAEPDSLRQVVAGRRPVVGQLAPSDADGRLRFPVRVPVERAGDLRYVLTAVIEPGSLVGLVRSRLPETEEWTRVIIDSGMRIAARSRDGERYLGRPVTAANVARVLNPPATPFQGTSLEGAPLYSSLSRGDYGWTTSVSVPAAVLDDPIRDSIVAIVSGGALLILGGLLSVVFVSRRVAREFAAARDAAAALAGGRSPASFRPQVAEAQDVQASLARAAQLLQDRGRERDEQLQRAVDALARAEEASRAKDEFLAVLGHELRNPLAPALTALELMKHRGGSALQRERTVIERQISHMTRLVDDLLDVSRLTRGKVDLVRRRFELRVAIDRAVDVARPLLEQHGHTLHVDVPGGELPLDADEDRIVQVLVNLLTNAAKYTPSGGHIRLIAGVADGFVEIACEDDGPGIPPAMVSTMFEPFAQGPRSIARQQGGLGLGLTLARSLTELHGGTVRYEAVAPHGSRFITRLPVAADDAVNVPAPDVVRPTSRQPIAPLRIMLVDDNTDAREMMRIALEEVGHQVDAAGDGQTALAMAAVLRPQLAILDIGLPGIDGYELARRLRADTPGMRLIALTGYGRDVDAKMAREAGFDAHCTKPVTMAALLERIAALDAEM